MRKCWPSWRVPAPAAPQAEQPATFDEALFEQLRRLRRELAAAANVPPYVILSDRTLVEMATFYPQTPAALLAINGVGQAKLERYGEPFLAVIRTYCSEHGIAEQPQVVRTGPDENGDSGKRRYVEVGDLFAAGASFEALQEMYGVKRATIVHHLADYQRAGGQLDGERVLAASTLTPAERQQVMAVFAELGTAQLTPVFERLLGQIAYEELHLVRLATATAPDNP